MFVGRLTVSLLFSSIMLALCGSILAEEAAIRNAAPLLIVDGETDSPETKDSQKSEKRSGPTVGRGRAKWERDPAFLAEKSHRNPLADDDGMAMVKFESSGCVLRDPAAVREYSEQEIYSVLLALSESLAKTARPFANSPDEIDEEARKAAERIMELQAAEDARIRGIMVEKRVGFDPNVTGLANRLAAGISPDRFEGAIGRNILPTAARYHAITIGLALEALELSDDEDARNLAHDLIADHSTALAEVKEAQQKK